MCIIFTLYILETQKVNNVLTLRSNQKWFSLLFMFSKNISRCAPPYVCPFAHVCVWGLNASACKCCRRGQTIAAS